MDTEGRRSTPPSGFGNASDASTRARTSTSRQTARWTRSGACHRSDCCIRCSATIVGPSYRAFSVSILRFSPIIRGSSPRPFSSRRTQLLRLLPFLRGRRDVRALQPRPHDRLATRVIDRRVTVRVPTIRRSLSREQALSLHERSTFIR